MHNNKIYAFFINFELTFQAVWVFSLIDYKSPTFNNGQYVYPTWASGIGWTIASLSLICIPLMAIIVLIRMPGDTFWQVKLYTCSAFEILLIPFCTFPRNLRTPSNLTFTSVRSVGPLTTVSTLQQKKDLTIPSPWS